MTDHKFPKDFSWGAATAAFQIEGHPDEAKAKLSDWSKWLDAKDASGKDRVVKPSNDGTAIDHYNRMPEDIKLLASLNANSYRFSFNWAAIHRGPGVFDEVTIDFYKRLFDELEKYNIEPFATLVHFVLPEWLASDGGWENPNTAYEFEKFATKMADEFGPRIQKWITHNEPNIFLWFGYESGIWPPGYENAWDRYLKAYQGILLGHKLAYQAIKARDQDSQVGIAQNLFAIETLGNYAEVPALIRDKIHNWLFIENAIEMNALDFLGVNYYSRIIYDFEQNAKDMANPKLDSIFWGQNISAEKAGIKNLKTNDLNWEIYPDGLYDLLTSEKMQNTIGDVPIYITENGYCAIEGAKPDAEYSTFADTDDKELDIEDPQRIDFINEHLKSVYKAIQEGTNIKGYFYWSLFDNFEWALGMRPRFGLIHVDHETFERKLKASAKHYAEICKANKLLEE